MRGSLKDTVIVITGASSGIGRATAHEFARRGGCVVLAARREAMLQEVEQECIDLGGTAMVVRTDVTKAEQVDQLALDAVAQFGRIDVWFNNAGVGVFGGLLQIPVEAWRRIIETNVYGCMHGARAALAQFRAQGHGLLINSASLAGRIGQPDSTAYATSKSAVRGLSESLRQELLDEPRIRVCTILPPVVDTPFFQHAANYSHHRVRAAPPVYPPEKVARSVAALVLRPRAEMVIGGFGRVMSGVTELLPAPTQAVLGKALDSGFIADEPDEVTEGTLFQPVDDGRAVSGGWQHGLRRGGVPLLAFTLVGLAVGWASVRGRRR